MTRTTTLDVLRFPLHGSRLIEASAGTGKTFTIALLYVRLVLGHGGEQSFGMPLTPPQILVVTFTEAATQELRQRIRARLVEAARCFADASSSDYDPLLVALRADYPAERWLACARLLEVAAEWMDEAAVSTIHGWCGRMLREHALDCGGLFVQNIVPDESELFLQVVRDYWRRNYYPLDVHLAQVVMHSFDSPDTLAKKLKPLLARSDTSYRNGESVVETSASIDDLLTDAGEAYAAADAAEDEARRAWRDDRENLARILHALRPGLNGTTYRNKNDDGVFYGWLAALDAWSEGALAPENIAKFQQNGIKVNKDVVVPEHPAFLAIERWQNALARLPDVSPQLLLHALGQVRAYFADEKQRRAELGFDDLLARLDHALGSESGERLAQRIRVQFPAALIDEFQDTDPLQYRIFERIYRVADNPRELGLFMIGDPKQAIYAFRGADIYTYLRARAATEGRHYTLDTNYRSTRELISALNRCFAFAETHQAGAFRFAQGDDNPVPFLPVEARGRNEILELDGKPTSALTFWMLDNGSETCSVAEYRQEMAERSASAVCAWLTQARAGQAGFRREDGAWRALRAADIAILVRSRHEAEMVRHALYARRLASVYLSDRDSVFETVEARDVQFWLRACADPGRDDALRDALATSTLDLSWHELDRLNTDERMWEENVLRFREYRVLWQQRGVLPMLRRLLADFDVPARLLRHPQGERTLTNLLHLAEWLQREAVELDGEHALLRALADRIDMPAGEEVLRLESDDDLIKVVTIHKSKGLEYPLVLLPFICGWTELAERGDALPVFRDNEARVVQLSGDKEVRRADWAKADNERLSEDMRLLYVAMTRARHALWAGVAPLANGRAKVPQLEKGAVGYLLGGGSALSRTDLHAKLKLLQDGCASIAIEDAPPIDNDEFIQNTVLSAGGAREPVRHVAERWWIASYSALAALDEEREDVAAPTEPLSATEERLREDDGHYAVGADAATAARSLHAFPRGATPGSFLHGLLEWAADEGFAVLAKDPARLRDQIARRCERRGWQVWINTLTDWLTQLIATDFALPDGASMRLASLGDYQREMEFWFSASEVDVQALDTAVRTHTLNGVTRPRLRDNRLNGMLKGFVDLVFEHEGRYFVADYKSNWLGASADDYNTDTVREVLLSHRYDLQYALYLFALHRLLRARLPDYDYDRHVGGAVYLFLRGIDAPTQGLYFDRPSRALMDELDRLFRSGHAD